MGRKITSLLITLTTLTVFAACGGETTHEIVANTCDATCPADTTKVKVGDECYCEKTVVEKTEKVCNGPSDCTCNGAEASCESGLCHCTKTIEVPPKPPTYSLAKVNVTDNGPAAKPVVRGSTDVLLLDFNMVATQTLTVKDTFIRLDIQNPSGTGPQVNLNTADTATVASNSTLASMSVAGDPSLTIQVGDMVTVHDGGSTGSGDTHHVMVLSADNMQIATNGGSIPVAAGATITEVNPYKFIKKISLVDLQTGYIVAGPTANGASNGSNNVIGPPTSYFKVHTEDFDLEAGKLRRFGILVDVDANMAVGYQLRAMVRFSDGVGFDSYIRDEAVGAMIPTQNITGAGITALAGNWMTTWNAVGDLTATAEGNPSAAVVVAETSAMLVSKYRFSAAKESFIVNKLTIVNDEAGSFDIPVATAAVANVTISYTNTQGAKEEMSASLATGGQVTFSGMGFYVAKGQDTYLEIRADVSSMSLGQALSGQTFRLGLRDVGNNAATFEAIGVNTSTVLNHPPINNGPAVNHFVVRKSVPTVLKTSGSSTTLINGENTLYSFTVAADVAGSISLGRMVFDVTTTGLSTNGTDDVYDFRLYRGNTLVSPMDVNIWGGEAAFADLQASSQGMGLQDQDGSANGGVLDRTYRVIVSFDREEIVDAGTSTTYHLKAVVVGAQSSSDSITTRLAIDDEASPVTGIAKGSTCGQGNNLVCSTGNGNTARLYDTFTGEGLFISSTTEFSRVPLAHRSFIWSDRSADAHHYPVVSAGTVIAGTGSFDWTNDYLLGLYELTSHTLQAN